MLEIVGAGPIGGHQIGPDRFHANAQRGHVHGFDRCIMQLANDRFRRFARQEQSDPVIRLEAVQPLLLRRWHLRQHCGSVAREHRERLDRSGFDLGQRG
jgi:hypothetical protein